MRDSGVEVDCPMGTENTENDNKTHTDSASTQSQKRHKQIPTLNITFSLLYSTRDPFSTYKCLTVRTSSVPAALPVRYQGPGLTLGFLFT